MELQAFLDDLAPEELWRDLLESPRAADPPSTSSGSKRVTSKQKIASLHAEIRALTAQLQALESQRQPRDPRTLTTSARRWQQIAARQLERRRNSESENAKLREMAALQVEEAKSLRRILKRRTRLQKLQEMLGGGAQEEQRVNRPLTIAAQETADDFKCMLRSVDELYGKMDALFVEKGVLGISCPGRRRHTDNTVLNGVCFELIRRDLVPFSIDMVNKAMWTALGLKELQGLQSAGEFKTDAHFREEKSEGDSETVMSSFLATHSSTGMAGIKVRKVVRRYVEGPRTVFIYQTFMEPRLFNLMEPVGVVGASTLLLEMSNSGVANAGEETTLLQSYFRATRHDEGLAAGHRLRLPMNLNAAVAVWDESISRIYNQMENSLLDEACRN